MKQHKDIYMTLTDRALWARIASYPMPADAAGVSFEDQLRDAHGISLRTARTAIAEYRRFLYLSALKQGRTVPTKAVDEVWHLHLTHTRDYWERFVPQVLDGQPIHHSPGQPQGHIDDFRATEGRYVAEFGEDPPKGMWKTATRKGNVLTGVLAVAFGLCFVTASLNNDVPLPFTAFAVIWTAIAAWSLFAALTTSDDGSVQFSIDIWADGEGGDCGSCGGGCGD